MTSTLKDLFRNIKRIAMEYARNCMLPHVSRVDAGTIEFVRNLGIEVVSSANIFQYTFARWTDEELQSHLRVANLVSKIKDEAFSFIREKVYGENKITEFDVQEFIMNRFAQEKLETEDRSIVAVNENSSKPHYEPTEIVKKEIKMNDWILIDLWAKEKGEHAVFADITWVGYTGRSTTKEHVKVFEVVKEARDVAISFLENAFQNNKLLEGWEVDRKVRNYIINQGFGQYFIHRTGHSISPGLTVHGLGVNIDDFETHDIRKIIPKVGFSIEPGIYIKDFGVRSEINVFMEKNGKPRVTSPLQDSIILL